MDKKYKDTKSIVVRIAAVAFWIAVWQVLCIVVGHSLLLPSPLDVVKRLVKLVPTGELWLDVWFSFSRIVMGFLMALVVGTALACLSYVSKTAEVLLHPLVATVKSVPVASFVVLALMCIPSRNLSLFISFLMVLPIIYINVLSGLSSTDVRMLEMARVFRLSRRKKVLYIYLSHVMPYFRSGCAVGLGLCWKAGVAAELIGVPQGSLGENLYYSKIYLSSEELFAWTAVIVLMSFLFEKLFLCVLDAVLHKAERM